MKEYLSSLLVLLPFILTSSAQPLQNPGTAKARRLQEFKRHNLGLMDISSDGKLLLLHQNLPGGDKEKRMSKHKLRVIEASSLRERTTIELQSSKPCMRFRPGSHQVLLEGQLSAPAEVGCFLWDVDSGTVHRNETLTETKLWSPQFVGPDQLVGVTSSGSSDHYYVMYDFRHNTLARLDVTRDEKRLFKVDPGLTFSPDFKTVVGRSSSKSTLTLREWETPSLVRRLEVSTGYPEACIYSHDGRQLIVLSTVTEGESRPIRVRESYLTIYDSRNLAVKKTQQILTDKLGENWILHVGFQIALSPNGRWLVVGYDRYTENLRIISHLQATYAVLEFPSLKEVAYAEHPQTRSSYDWAEVSPAQSGRLRFDADSRGFYTTSKYTIHWALPE
jgi:hypothetical protein